MVTLSGIKSGKQNYTTFGKLYGIPWVTIQDGGLPVATLSGIKSEQQYNTMADYMGLHAWVTI